MEEMVCKFELPAGFSPLRGTLGMPVPQSIPSVPKAAQGVEALRPGQVFAVLFTVEHNLRPDVGNVKFNGTEIPGFTRFN